MKKQKRQRRGLWVTGLALLGVAGAFFANVLVRALERTAYPRSSAPDVRQYAAQYEIEENMI